MLDIALTLSPKVLKPLPKLFTMSGVILASANILSNALVLPPPTAPREENELTGTGSFSGNNSG
ncbi:hypothetical protein D3C80_1595320 [compost metagenome]